MARYALINTTVVGSRRHFAGDILDDAVEARTVFDMREAGATLALLPNPDIELAAARALARRRAGAQASELDSIMLGAWTTMVAGGASAANPWLVRTEWYVSVDDGDDSNDGSSWEQALRTLGELTRRWGPSPEFGAGHMATVHVAFGYYDEVADFSGVRFFDNGSGVRVIGYPKVVYADGRVGTYYYPDSAGANGRMGEIEDNVSPPWASYAGRRIHFDPGGANESVSFVYMNKDASRWPNWANVGAAIKARASWGGFQSVGSFAVDTPYVIEELPRIRSLVVKCHRYSLTGSPGQQRTFTFENLEFYNPSGQAVITVENNGGSFPQGGTPVLFWGCQFGTSDMYVEGAAFVGCGWGYPDIPIFGTGSEWYFGEMWIEGCISSGGHQFNNAFIRNIGGPSGPGHCQFGGLSFYNSRTSRSGIRCGVFRQDGTGGHLVEVDYQSSVVFDTLFGKHYDTTDAKAFVMAVGGKGMYVNTPKVVRGTAAPRDVNWGTANGTTGVDWASLPAASSLGVEGFVASMEHVIA